MAKRESKPTPAAIFDLSALCLSSSLNETMLSRTGSNRMPIYHSERRYFDRTPNIRLITAGSLVIRSLGPTLASEPEVHQQSTLGDCGLGSHEPYHTSGSPLGSPGVASLPKQHERAISVREPR